MTKTCCTVNFHTFSPSTEYSPLECLIMNLYSISTTKDPKKSKEKIKMLRDQSKTLYRCCNDPRKITHSFGELKEHVIYINQEHIQDAKRLRKK